VTEAYSPAVDVMENLLSFAIPYDIPYSLLTTKIINVKLLFVKLSRKLKIK